MYSPVLAQFMSRDPALHSSDVLYSVPNMREPATQIPQHDAYSYVRNNPINWNDPSGLYASANGGISDDEGEKLKDCKCGFFDAKPGGAVYGVIKCDGSDGFKTEVIDPRDIMDPSFKACWEPCGFDKCNKEHEEHHIEQFKAICPGFCDCLPADRMAIGFTTAECREKSECYGWKAFFSCLKKAYDEMLKKDPKTKCAAPVNTPCKTVLKAFVEQGWGKFEKPYNCKAHKIEFDPKAK